MQEKYLVNLKSAHSRVWETQASNAVSSQRSAKNLSTYHVNEMAF